MIGADERRTVLITGCEQTVPPSSFSVLLFAKYYEYALDVPLEA
jgi:hypothetical protein